MSALTVTAAPARPSRPVNVLRLSLGRLLRLELRRSAMRWMLPLMLGVFWLDTYRASLALPALWGSRALLLRQGQDVIDFAPFVAGAAAWAGGRDARGGIGDQLAAVALPRWAARLSAWAATACWALTAYLLGVGALYAVTAGQGAPGDPLWWPVLVGAAALTAVSALGYAAGVLLPSRFTAPLTAIVAFDPLSVTYKTGGSLSLVSPMISPSYAVAPLRADAGVFSPYLPDQSLLQILFLGGLAVAALGALGVQAVCGAPRLRRTAAVVVAAGLAALLTAVGLAGGYRVTEHGVVIPALHSAADDRPFAATPVCAGAPVPVCLNPVYRAYLPTVGAMLDPLLREVAGLPGAPVRVGQVPLTSRGGPSSARLTGSPGGPDVGLDIGLDIGFDGMRSVGPDSGPGRCCTSDQIWLSVPTATRQALPPIAIAVVDGLVGRTSPAQQAVSAGLLTALGVSASGPPDFPGAGDAAPPPAPEPGTPVYAAAQRFAALPAASRHAWLAANLATLRAGTVPLEQLP